MKKIIALGLAVAGAVWFANKAREKKPQDVWAASTDSV